MLDFPAEGGRRVTSVSSNLEAFMPTIRRTCTPEFKAEAVKLVTEQGRSFVEVSRDLDIGDSTLRGWRDAIAKDGQRVFPGRGIPPALEEELRRLRADVKRLTMERDILKEATACFAGGSS